MSDTLVLALTALLALGVLGWTVWGIWHIAQHTPTRQRALTHMLGIIAGTALAGVVLPAVLMGSIPSRNGSSTQSSRLGPPPYSRGAGTHWTRGRGAIPAW